MAKKREWKAWMVRGGERELSEIAYGTRKAAMLGISHAKHWTLTKPLKVIRVRIVEDGR